MMMEITNAFKKMVASLGSSKGRAEERCFVAEGTKCVTDTWNHFSCRYLIATRQWIEAHAGSLSGVEPIVVSGTDLQRMSQLKTPQGVIAVYDIPNVDIDHEAINRDLTIVLDRVQDPGNLGTIMRVADWFGISRIVCSYDTVDVYNPKVVQATMGAISRVRVNYCDLAQFIERHAQLPIYGTFLDGDNIYETELSSEGLIIMGNEGRGISEKIEQMVTRKLLVPSFPIDRPTSESLNVGMATAIVVAEFRRRLI